MRTPEEYFESLRAMKPNVYMEGEAVKRDDPRLIPAINVMRLTYDMASDPQYEELFTATSHYTGEKINRFTNIYHSPEDLLTKQDMIRTGARASGFCIQRCMGLDAINAISVASKEIDEAHGTEYYSRFLEYIKNYQKNDLAGAGAQTDVKGDRSKRPHQQADPDLYVHIVDRTKDGIIVKGAKEDITMAAIANELLVFPTRTLRPEESDWAVAFAVPADWDNIYILNRSSAPRARKSLKAPLNTYGSCDAMIVFDNVFVPWERVFMCGEHEFGGRLALQFAINHRHSYTGCKPAVSDIVMGLIALAAEYYGVEGADHIRQKLADVAGIAELVYGAGIAAAVRSKKASSGTYMPDPIFCNVARRLAGENIYHEWNLVADVAGGFPVTMPYEEDYLNPKTASFVNKYTMRNPKISAENMHRLQRTLSDYLASGWGGVWQVAGVHGGGSPIMETIGILGAYDFEERKRVVRRLAGIPEEPSVDKK